MSTSETTVKAAPPKPKGFSNPALQAMGIPRIRIPSRNWLIFWAVTGSIASIWIYDRRERKRVRQQWKDRVSFLSKQTMSPMDLPRKVTVYVAPPPADYLDLGFQHFRQYIKPILVAGAVDYEVRSENRQGEIRSMVAEEMRNKRRKELGLPTTEPEQDELDQIIRSHVKENPSAGVICVGRGAYKEYMNGLHEGLLGPLEAPKIEQIDEETQEGSTTPDLVQKIEQPAETEVNSLDNVAETTGSVDPAATLFPDKEDDAKDVRGELTKEEKDKKEKAKKPVPKPYLLTSDYATTQAPFEFDRVAQLETVAPIAFPHLLGILNTPIRIYRFFTKRRLADQMGQATAAVVLEMSRAYDHQTDPNALKEEENDWPNQWKKKSLANNSEWMWEFEVDERIASRLTTFEYAERGESGESSEFAPESSN